MRKILTLTVLLALFNKSKADTLLIPMDSTQKDHLKSYGFIFRVLKSGNKADWLLNYRGGCFAVDHTGALEAECKAKNISFTILNKGQYENIRINILYPNSNTGIVRLEKAPRIAVYTPKNKKPWDDAVTLALAYAEIPYDTIYDDEIMKGILSAYDWVHLHHEDFTGQFGKFWASYKNEPWYQNEVATSKEAAARFGFKKVSQLKLAVIKKLKDFVAQGGCMFAMCSATDTYDIGMAAEGVDICSEPFDGDPMDSAATKKLDYSKTLAFKDFKLVTSPYEYEYSDIDVPPIRPFAEIKDSFNLLTFSAKVDLVSAMLCQNHVHRIKGFMGQTTAFRNEKIKPGILIMAENKSLKEARYIRGEYGKGMWTFYGGHDPEDYQHMVGNMPTNLKLHPNSPGYRLILNNIFLPSANLRNK